MRARPRRRQFLAFLKGWSNRTSKGHPCGAGQPIHHTTPEVQEWLGRNPRVHFHFTPVGSSWINQVETWFGIITRQSIRRGTFSVVWVLVRRIRDYITN